MARKMSRGVRLSVILIAACAALAGCEDRPKAISSTSSGSSSSSSAATSTTSAASVSCAIFSTNSRDYQLCLGCVTSTGSADLTTLAKCVHSNSGSTGGAACAGLACGSGQTPDFAACKCVDSAPPTTFAGTPGQDDTSTPYLQAGFSIGNRYCTNANNRNPVDCFWVVGGGTGNQPTDITFPPLNVFTDVGYMRWDLSLDNSQYPAYISEKNGADDLSAIPFVYSSATMPGNFSFSYQLKPNTVLASTNSSTVDWCDCVEHYSGFGTSMTTPSSCLTSANVCSSTAASLTLASSNYSGTAELAKVSMNGAAANLNLTYLSSDKNDSAVRDTVVPASLLVDKGIAKKNSTDAYGRTGLFSNIGYYKYTLGPFSVARPGSTTTAIASGSVTGQIAINANLGFNPASTVESTAFAPDAVSSHTVASRACTDSTDPCVVTVLYRTTGGAVNYQSFSPKFTSHISARGTLPSGVTAVGTPKVIQDTANLTSSLTTPARLRAFVRAADGNIYMSKGVNGAWSPWMNLGRPWTAPNAYPTSSTAPAPVYWAFTNNLTLAQGWPDADGDQTPPPGGTMNQNDGISIVGEPTVAYYEEASSPGKAMIVIAVRVSQILYDGTPGSYHNSVFMTIGRQTSTSSTFDNANNWTRWIPVQAGGTLLKIQGNPLLFVNDIDTSSAGPRAYIFGTKLAEKTMTGVTTNLHPPIAPDNTDKDVYTTKTCPTFNVGTCAYESGTKNWFSYGYELVYGVVNLNGHFSGTTFNCTTDATCNNVITWTLPPAASSSTGVFISDWTGVVHSTNHIRVFANTLAGYNSDGTNSDCTAAGRTWLRAPITEVYSDVCGYGQDRTYVTWYEYTFSGGGLAATTPASGTYPKTNFVGSVYPVDVAPNGIYRYTTPSNIHVKTYIDPIATSTKARIALFGRYTNSAKTRTTPPTTEIATVNYPANGTDDSIYSVYTADGSVVYNVAAVVTSGSSRLVPPNYPTSDIVPVYSRSLEKAEIDVPVYIFSRDSSGALVVGIWQSSKQGTTGPRWFNFYNAGGFVN